MAYGPVELVVLKYYGDHFTGIPAALVKRLVDDGMIRIIDTLFARKDADGKVDVFELGEIEGAADGDLSILATDATDFFNRDDILALTAEWEPRTTGVALMFENVWAGAFREAVTDAGGEVVLIERIPRAVIEELEAYSPEAVGS